MRCCCLQRLSLKSTRQEATPIARGLALYTNVVDATIISGCGGRRERRGLCREIEVGYTCVGVYERERERCSGLWLQTEAPLPLPFPSPLLVSVHGHAWQVGSTTPPVDLRPSGGRAERLCLADWCAESKEIG